MKISVLASVIAVLSILSTNVAEAAVPAGHDGEVRNGQAQGQSSGGVHTDSGNSGANGGDVHK